MINDYVVIIFNVLFFLGQTTIYTWIAMKFS